MQAPKQGSAGGEHPNSLHRQTRGSGAWSQRQVWGAPKTPLSWGRDPHGPGVTFHGLTHMSTAMRTEAASGPALCDEAGFPHTALSGGPHPRHCAPSWS